MIEADPAHPVCRLKVVIRGAVQGVGFRPFIFRLAQELRLAGWVNNSSHGVLIDAEGPRPALDEFLSRIETEKPPHSSLQSFEVSWLEPVGAKHFEIRESRQTDKPTALVMPDIAMCPDCLRETFDPDNRRYRYPFTNCTHCGPRFSIVESLPYDRAGTSMKTFKMCPACQAEYDDPADRRFHAQPNACPVCGPQLTLLDPDGAAIFGGDKALLAAANALRRGRIVAVKGIGGFHLMVDARNENAVQRLRGRKHREEKPLALLFPSVESLSTVCEVSPAEERLLWSPEAPIVLLKRRPAEAAGCCEADELCSTIAAAGFIAPSVAPGNPCFGVMLPSNPLHYLLMAELDFPVVATSGNLADEPICIDQREALERLGGVADLFLVHDRPIVRHVDDSIVRIVLDREMVVRRARGYAPLPIALDVQGSRFKVQGSDGVESPALDTQPILAVGAHLKNTVALAVGEQVFVSQHIGDLETEPAYDAFRRVIADFERLYDTAPGVIASDLHPDYLSTRFGVALPGRHVRVQHHIAHALSCMAENEVRPPALAVVWDGTGYGLDGTIWGGEFFLVLKTDFERIAHFRPFQLPGGEQAIREPRRAAAGVLYALAGEAAFERTELASIADFSPFELSSVKSMLMRDLNSPAVSSAGRLFDAIASLLDIRQCVHFEGQAAMELEFAAEEGRTDEAYPLPYAHDSSSLDWRPTIEAVLADLGRGALVSSIAAKFHNALVEAIVAVARSCGLDRVVLSGGCFQNRYLIERTVRRLREEQFRVHWHQRVPTNDGGIALGQVVAARRQMAARQL